ncbi:hypothetical protein L6R52_39650 [Myxococcota bacterium]|nr:hypothetical protein [Myxococcota bacterium]
MITSLERVLAKLLVAGGALSVASWVALTFVHLDTLYDVNQTSGAWLAQAWYFAHGVLYPPLHADGWYAGTRYFPGFFVLHGTLARWTGEYLSSGKLVTFASTLGVASMLVWVITRRTRDGALAVAFAGVLLATFIGHKGSLTIRSDVLPLALCLACVAITERDVERTGGARFTGMLALSAVLGGLAPLVKFTALHGLTASALFLALRHRRVAVAYGALGAAVLALGVLATNAASDGRFFENLAGTAVAPENHTRSFVEALSIYALYVRMDPGFLVLLPFALFAAVAPRPVDPWRIFFALHLVVSLGFFFDTGGEYNHLVDLVAASVILCGTLAAKAPRAIVRVAVLAAATFSVTLGLATMHRAAWTAPELDEDPRTLFVSTMGLGDGSILVHDPTVAVLLDRRPVVADDFQYRVLVTRGKVPRDELPQRIRAHAFDHVVLLNPPAPSAEDPGFSDVELGPWVARAIRDAYVLERRVGKFFVYRPRTAP